MPLFTKFEDFLKKAEKPQKILIYLMPAMIVGGLIFMIISPMQVEELEMLESENAKLQSNIKRKAPRTVKRNIQLENKKLLALKEKMEEDRDSLHYLYAKLTNMEVLEFNEHQWTATLDEILKKSLTLDITIKHIKNSDSEQKNIVENIIPKKYVEIIGSGKYSDTLKYLHFIENQQFLVDIKNIKMNRHEESQDIDFHINFTIYGVNI